MCVSESDGLLFVGDVTGKVSVFKENPLSVSHTIDLTSAEVLKVVFDEVNDLLYAGLSNGRVVIFDYAGQSFVATLDLFTEEAQVGIGQGCISGNFVFFGGSAGKICTINRTGSPSCTQTYDAGYAIWGLAAYGDFIYFSDGASPSNFVKLHRDSLTPSATYTLPAASEAKEIGVDSILERLYICTLAVNGVLVFNTNLSLLSTICLGVSNTVVVDSANETGIAFGSAADKIVTFNTNNYEVGTTLNIENAKKGVVDSTLDYVWIGSDTNDKIQLLINYDLGC